MGTSFFAAAILEALIKDDYNIISVYTKPDQPVGRDQKVRKSEVKILSEQEKLRIFTPEKIDKDTILEIKEQEPDIIIVASYGKILTEEILKLPRFGAINVHASLLPKFRGPSPIQNAILNGEKETGATIMLMDKGIDTGDILSQQKIDINPEETYPELLKRISQLSSYALLKTLPLWIRKKISPKKQEENKATYCQLIERSDGKIIWTNDARSIYKQWRALLPWPGIFTYWEKNGVNLRLKLTKISPVPGELKDNREMGEVMDLNGKTAVKAASGIIILEEIQLEGKAKVKIGDFINGHPDFIGSRLK